MHMKWTGAHQLLACLREEGVDLVFGYPGGANLPVYDALVDFPDLAHILVRHEQGAAHAADGYARASGKAGVCFATSGPGATNLVTGLAAAFMDSSPMVAITGQVGTSLLGTDAFQEVDTVGITLPVTKRSFFVRRTEEIPATVHAAFAAARSGRPGPVLVDLPKDLGAADAPRERHELPVAEGHRPAEIDEGRVAEAASLLGNARRPVLYVGGGAARANASGLVRFLARELGIPVTTTLMALGTFPTDDPLFLGMPGMHGTKRANLAFRDADLVVAIGARFDDRVTGRAAGFSPHSKRVQIDVDPFEMGKICRADVRLAGDAREILMRLRKAVAKRPDTAGWLAELSAHSRVPPAQGVPPDARVRPQELFSALSACLPEDALLVTDVGQHQMWAAQFGRFSRPGTFLTSGGLGAMGFGLPAAMGAKLACPERTVVAVVGDGGFQMTAQELSTMRRYGIRVAVLLLDNQALGMVRQWQDLFHGARRSEVDLSDNPDFVRLGEAMGVPGARVDRAEELPAALSRALAEPGPFLVHARLAVRESVFPIVPPGAPAHEMLEESAP